MAIIPEPGFVKGGAATIKKAPFPPGSVPVVGQQTNTNPRLKVRRSGTWVNVS